jgi:hypothetical protein
MTTLREIRRMLASLFYVGQRGKPSAFFGWSKIRSALAEGYDQIGNDGHIGAAGTQRRRLLLH